MYIKREKIEFDVLFVGGGPASLAGAIKLAQLAKEKNQELEIALIEKGPEIGNHALSGAVFNPIALKELMPKFIDKGFPFETIIKNDSVLYLTKNKYFKFPYLPKQMHNKDSFIISVSKFTKWLGEIAEELGINIFSGFSGKKVLYSKDDKSIIGVQTADKGLAKDGTQKSNFEPGIDIIAKVTVFGEGAKGSLFSDISKKMNLFDKRMPQAFELGIKEVIEVNKNSFFKDNNINDIHTIGYPLGLNHHGGGFIYEMSDNRVSVGLVSSLAYTNPLFDIYDEFIKYKKHPFVANIIRQGRVIEQGARTIPCGGYYTIPKLYVNGAVFIGASASIQNSLSLKGLHLCMKSGMLAAEAIADACLKNDFSEKSLSSYEKLFDKSYIKDEMFETRNFFQAMKKNILLKSVYFGSQYVTKGKGMRDNMPINSDYTSLKHVNKKQIKKQIDVNKKDFDNVLYVDKLTGVYLSKTNHREDQPSHIKILDENICIDECKKKFKNPCLKFCPANVYELRINKNGDKDQVVLNPSNCLHCKTCEIKDPYQNIVWTTPEGADGPGYTLT